MSLSVGRSELYSRVLARAVLGLLMVGLPVTVGVEASPQEVRVGGDFSYPPFEFLDARGRVTGFNVDLLAAIGREADLELIHGLGAWHRQHNALLSGRLDVLPMFISDTRDIDVDFTQPFLIVNHEVFIRKGGPEVNDLGDLVGLEVIVERNAFSHEQLEQLAIGIRLILVRSESEAMQLLATGSHDAAILGELRGRRMLSKGDYPDITTSGPPILPAAYAFAVQEGNDELRDRLDDGLARVKASGEFNTIYARWLDPDAQAAFWERMLKLFAALAIGVVAVMLGVSIWLRTLRRQVRLRTRELAESEERFRKTFEHAAIGLAWLTPSGEWVGVNPSLARSLGSSPAEVMKEHPRHWLAAQDFRRLLTRARGLARGDRDVFSLECSFRRSDDQLGWAEIGVSVLRETSGAIGGFIVVLDDLSESQRLAAQLSFRETHDELTGLANRGELEKRVQTLLRKNSIETHVLLYIDLDHFKVVNESCGHDAGDELLGKVGHVLSDELEEDTLLARLGGDEFAVLLEAHSASQGMEVAENLREALARGTFSWEGQSFSLKASVGVVTFRAGDELVGGVLGAADSACYMAKAEGGNRSRAHVAGDDTRAGRLQGDVRWVARINKALEEGHFELFSQAIKPLQKLDEGEHYEILLRLRDAGGQLVGPGEFLPAAERYYLMENIDRWVLRTALRMLAEHPRHLDSLSLCTINLSGQSISNPEFQRYLESRLDQYRVPASKICFEITESAAMADLNQAVRFARRLKERGCRFALDDFGIGMSSFAYLRNLPFDILKIDGTFVTGMKTQPLDKLIVESVSRAAWLLGKQSVAEFVETNDLLHEVRTMGIEYAQGYAIERPRPLAERLAASERSPA
ncbi:MAG: EAL domain-containing protein [Gammaproteobacteria bacterium]|nr:EAL domain-containing protein [Gammaproteobacteria bacterium]